ncbi:MAG: hypothetical protein RTU92_09075 [Candidatus Thorarchaeota archaeon]
MSTKERDHHLIGLKEDQDDEEVRDPLDLALHGKKFTKITLEDIERVSSLEQLKYTGDSS